MKFGVLYAHQPPAATDRLVARDRAGPDCGQAPGMVKPRIDMDTKT